MCDVNLLRGKDMDKLNDFCSVMQEILVMELNININVYFVFS